MFCNKCGVELPDDATFCVGCGQKIGKDDVAEIKPNPSHAQEETQTHMGMKIVFSFFILVFGLFPLLWKDINLAQIALSIVPFAVAFCLCFDVLKIKKRVFNKKVIWKAMYYLITVILCFSLTFVSCTAIRPVDDSADISQKATPKMTPDEILEKVVGTFYEFEKLGVEIAGEYDEGKSAFAIRLYMPRLEEIQKAVASGEVEWDDTKKVFIELGTSTEETFRIADYTDADVTLYFYDFEDRNEVLFSIKNGAVLIDKISNK